MPILSLKCASCSAPLQIKPYTKDFVCAYCGVAQTVDRSGGAISLKLLTQTLGRVEKGTDRTASELALVRLSMERKQLGVFVLTKKPALAITPPLEPKFARPVAKTGSFNSLRRWLRSDSLEGQFRNLDEDYDFALKKGVWDNYDREMAIHRQLVADWPGMHENELKARAEHEKRLSELDAEIAFHQSIVKPS